MGAEQLPQFIRRPVERLARAFAASRIVLYGSYAKGTAQQWSDVDLLLVADLAGDLSTHQRRAQQLVSDCFPPVDVHVCTPADLDDARAQRSLFLLSVLESGITVHSR